MAKEKKYLIALVFILQIILGIVTHNVILLVCFLGVNFLIFYLIISNLEKKNTSQNSTRQADLSVKIAHETLPFMRRGLNEKNAHAIAKIIQDIGQVAAVSITDCEKQLAYIGAGCDRHHPGDKILTEATREVIKTNNFKIVQTQG